MELFLNNGKLSIGYETILQGIKLYETIVTRSHLVKQHYSTEGLNCVAEPVSFHCKYIFIDLFYSYKVSI